MKTIPTLSALLGVLLAAACVLPPTEVTSGDTSDTSDASTSPTAATVDATMSTGDATSPGTTGTTTDVVDTTMDAGSTTESTTADTSTGEPILTETEVITAGPGLNRTIFDDAYDGTLGSMTCQQLDVTEDGIDLVEHITVEVGISHNWVGDLVIKLESPGGSVITLMSRPGVTEPADDGAFLGGATRSNLSPQHRVHFFDEGPTDAEQMGSTLTDGQTICRDDGLCDYSPNPGAATPGDLSSLSGQSSAGTWRLCVADTENLVDGSLDYVALTIDQVSA